MNRTQDQLGIVDALYQSIEDAHNAAADHCSAFRVLADCILYNCAN